MKKIAIIILLFLLVPKQSLAATEQKAVWFEAAASQSDTRPALAVGDDILVYARVNNATKEAITYNISFSVDGVVIGTRVAAVPSYAQLAVSIPWTLPQESTEVAAIVTKAVGPDKKERENLVGTVGTVQVGNVTPIIAGDISNMKGFAGKILSSIEAFRLKQLAYFSELLVKSRVILGTTTLKDVSTLLQPEPINPDSEVVTPEKKSNQIGGYAQLFYATAGKALFSHKATFYVVGLLLTLFVLRFIFSRLF